MAMHAKSGGDLEVMGMLAGRAAGDAFVVLDAFALPVVGTETRVNAQSEANEYMIDFLETNKVRKREEREREGEREKGREMKGEEESGDRMRGRSHFPFLSSLSKNHKTRKQLSGKQENLVGWYHSHPGYGCWLSGIDVGTQVRSSFEFKFFSRPFLGSNSGRRSISSFFSLSRGGGGGGT